MPIYNKIKDAIKNKQVIKAVYKNRYYEICPHILGSKEGHRRVLCYQFKSLAITDLEKDNHCHWLCIPLSELSEVEITDGNWRCTQNTIRPSECMDTIDCMVNFEIDL